MEGLKLRFESLRILLVVSIITAALMVSSTETYASGNDEFKTSQRIGSEVYTELQGSPDGRAYVVVLLEKPVLAADATRTVRQSAVRQVQDHVLQRFAPGEFSIVHKYNNFSSMTGFVNEAGLAKLAADPHVISVGTDVGGHGCLDVSVPFINADNVQDFFGYTGEGITVAVLDSGIDSDHPDLFDNVADGWYHYLAWWMINQWVTDYGPGAEDDHGHGTNVAGIITSRGVVASKGVAPDADILAIKVLDSANNFGRTSEISKGVDYVIDHKDDYDNLCIINMSLGTDANFSECPCDNAYPDDPDYTWLRTLRDALNEAKDAGIVIFAASGNNAYDTNMPAPACLSAATAVAAVYDQDLGREPDSGEYGCGCHDETTYGDLILCLSNRNCCNALAAPGARITAPGKGGGTSTFTGTSQASPHCAGVAALMCEKTQAFELSLTPSEIVQIMKDTGVPTVDPYLTSPNPKRVDAFSAVNAFQPWRTVKKYWQRSSVSGMDIRCDRSDWPGPIPRVLADDFLSTETGPIIRVILWTSWQGDSKLSANNLCIHLSIYDNIPDPDGGFSKPGNLLWERYFHGNAGEFTEFHYYTIPPYVIPGSAPWYDPAGGVGPIFGDHKQTWQYSMSIDPCDAFVVQGDPCEPAVYWLSVDARYTGTIFLPAPQFGWRTSYDHWNDCAVWSDDDGQTWNEVCEPGIGDPIDMAFKITTRVCCSCANYNADDIVNFEDYADFVGDWGWSGQSGGGYNDYDINCDGDVDFYDVAVFSREWLSGCMDECRYCY